MHKDIVKRIRKLRKDKNFSTQEMAERLNIDLSAYTRLESGKTYTWAKYLDDLLGIFEISVEDFFKGIGSEVSIKNKSGSFGGNMHVENMFADNKENISRIEQLYEARLKDKDLMIEQLQKIIEKMR